MAIRFYATEADIRTVLSEVECRARFHYAETGLAASEGRVSAYASHAEIERLAQPRTRFECWSALLLYAAGSVLTPRLIRPEVFVLDQLWNPETVCFTVGGLFLDRAVIAGEVASAYKSPFAQRVLREFRESMKRHFTSTGGVFIGTEALEFYRRGLRFTQDPDANPDCDLRLPEFPPRDGVS